MSFGVPGFYVWQEVGLEKAIVPERVKEMSARQVDSLKTDGRYAVGGVVGLHLRVRGKSRSWFLRITHGRRCDLGLGSYPEVTLAAARERAWEFVECTAPTRHSSPNQRDYPCRLELPKVHASMGLNELIGARTPCRAS